VVDDVIESPRRMDLDSQVLLEENPWEAIGSRAAGFVGKNFEVQWLCSCFIQNDCITDPCMALTHLERTGMWVDLLPESLIPDWKNRLTRISTMYTSLVARESPGKLPIV
jgi:hypothetical protein